MILTFWNCRNAFSKDVITSRATDKSISRRRSMDMQCVCDVRITEKLHRLRRNFNYISLLMTSQLITVTYKMLSLYWRMSRLLDCRKGRSLQMFNFKMHSTTPFELKILSRVIGAQFIHSIAPRYQTSSGEDRIKIKIMANASFCYWMWQKHLLTTNSSTFIWIFEFHELRCTIIFMLHKTSFKFHALKSNELSAQHENDFFIVVREYQGPNGRNSQL